MSAHVLEFEGYQGSIEVSLEDNCLFGRLLHTEDLVTFEGNSPAELKSAFENSVREYVEFCREQGKEPNRPFKGSLNIRIGPELHEQAAKLATRLHLSLNDLIKDTIQLRIADTQVDKVQEIHHHDHKHYSISIAGPVKDVGYFGENGIQLWQDQRHPN